MNDPQKTKDHQGHEGRILGGYSTAAISLLLLFYSFRGAKLQNVSMRLQY